MPRSLATVGLISILALVGGPQIALPSPGRDATASQPVQTTQPTQAPATERFDIVDQIGGVSNAVALHGPWAYVGAGPRVLVWRLDMTDTAPVGGSAMLPGVVRDIVWRDDRLYVGIEDSGTVSAPGATDQVGGLVILDVSEPAAPRQLSWLSRPASVRQVAVDADGTHVFLAESGGQAGTLGVVDAADPEHPRILAAESLGGPATGVAVAGRTAYVIEARDTRTAVRTFDLTDYEHPRKVGLVTLSGKDGTLSISGNWLYAAMGGDGLFAVDVAQPAAPRLVGKAADGCPSRVAVDGGRVWFGDPCSERLRLSAINSDGTLRTLGETVALGDASGGAAFDGDFAAVTAVDGGLQAVVVGQGGVSGSSGVGGTGGLVEPAVLRQWPGRALQVAVADGLVATATEHRVSLMTMVGDGRLRPGASLRTTETIGSLAVAPERVYYSTWTGRPPTALRFVDASDTGQPRERAVVTTRYPGNIVATAHQLVVVTETLTVFDAQDLALPKLVGSLKDVGGRARLAGDRMAVFGFATPAYRPIVSLVDLSDPAQPRLDERFDLENPGLASFAGIAAGESFAFALASDGPFAEHSWIQVFDLRTRGRARRQPGGVGGIGLEAEAAAVDGATILVGSSTGLVAADVSAPGGWAASARMALPAKPQQIAVHAGRTYVADGDAGLLVIERRPASAPMPTPSATRSATLPPIPTRAATPAPTSTSSLMRTPLYLPALAKSAPVKPVAKVQLTQDAQLAGPCFAVTSDGTLGYLGEGRQVRVIDPHAADQSGLLVGTSPLLQGVVRGLAVRGGYLYAAIGDAGLVILDVHTPSQPRIVGAISFLDLALAVAVEGDRAYVATGDEGLQILDVQRPDQPRLVGSVPIEGWSHKVVVAGGRVFVGVQRGRWDLDDEVMGVAIVDARQLQSAHVESFVKGGISDFFASVEFKSSIDFAVSEGFLFLPADPVGLAVIDVRDPARPVKKAVLLDCGKSPACKWVGAFSIGQLAVYDHYLYASRSSTWGPELIQIFDIANPLEPIFLGIGPFDGEEVNGNEKVSDLATVGTTILQASLRYRGYGDSLLHNSSGKLQMIDAANAKLPVLGLAYAPAMSFGQMEIVGRRVYAVTGDYEGLNVRTLPALHVLGLSRSRGLEDFGAVAGDLEALQVVAGDGWAAGVAIADGRHQTLIFDPTSADPLQPVAMIDTQDAWPVAPNPRTSRLAAADRRLFIPASDGVRLFDLTDLRVPRYVATAPVTGSLEAMGGGLALIADRDMHEQKWQNLAFQVRWRVVDMAGAPAVRVLSTFEATLDPPISIVMNGKVAYLVDEDGKELLMIDLSDATRPQVLAGLPLGDVYRPSLALDGAVLYVTGRADKSRVLVRAYDLTNPIQPREIASVPVTPYRNAGVTAYGVAARDGLVLVGISDGDGYHRSLGLAAFRLER